MRKMEKHLKSQQYYINLYDRHTVERCRDLIRIRASKPDREPALLNGEKPPKELVETVSMAALEWMLMFEKGNRYIHKEETIERWAADAREADDIYDSAKAPESIRCLTCRSAVSVVHKDLWGGYKEPYRVLFMYECPNKCRPLRAFYNDGEEWKYRTEPCPKCGGRLNSEDKTTKEKFITYYKCSSCTFTKTDELERTANRKEELDPNFDADRAKFCLSKEGGEKWRQELVNMEQMKKLVDEFKERDKNKEVYDKIAKLKKLTVIELEKLLIPALEKDNYVHLKLADPEIDKIVAVPFVVQDAKSGRDGRASEYDLKRLLKKMLEDTNWRLMSDGVSYRLGVLSGRLRGYESEDDLIKLIK